MKKLSHPWCNAVKDPAWRSMWMLCWTIVRSSGSVLVQHVNKAGSFATKFIDHAYQRCCNMLHERGPVSGSGKRKVCLLGVFKDLKFLSLPEVMIPNGQCCFNGGWDLWIRTKHELGCQASSGTSIAGSSYGGRRTPIFEPQDFHHNSAFGWFFEELMPRRPNPAVLALLCIAWRFVGSMWAQVVEVRARHSYPFLPQAGIKIQNPKCARSSPGFFSVGNST